jgi:hypothetical protein
MCDLHNAGVGHAQLVGQIGNQDEEEEKGDLHVPGDCRVEEHEPTENHVEFGRYRQPEEEDSMRVVAMLFGEIAEKAFFRVQVGILMGKCVPKHEEKDGTEGEEEFKFQDVADGQTGNQTAQKYGQKW